MGGMSRGKKGFGVFLLAIPWSWYLVLATVTFVIFHGLAGREIPSPDQTPEEIAISIIAKLIDAKNSTLSA